MPDHPADLTIRAMQSSAFQPLALVLGGGGARGAYQVGAIRALLEAGIRPDLLVGTSAGAANATYLAWRGVRLAAVDELEGVWRDLAQADLLPTNHLWLALRVLSQRAGRPADHRMRDFLVAQGVSPELCFGDLQEIRLILVATDLNCGRRALYGIDPQQSVLEGLLASTAIPPWVHPLAKGEQLLVDGGVVSNLPVQAALEQGARSVIALDVADPRTLSVGEHGFAPLLGKLIGAAEQRQMELELALATASGVPVKHVVLRGDEPVATWDFQHTDALIAHGYQTARRAMDAWPQDRPPWWRAALARWADRLRRNQ